MSNQDMIPSDPLGLHAGGESLKIAVKWATSFLNKIVGPASEEFGQLLRDRVSFWRAKQAVGILQKSEEMLNASGGPEGKMAPPRLLFSIIEHGSWIDDDNIQNMWAGLLASSCTDNGRDDGNLVFINLLSQLTIAEARILNYSCEKAQKGVSSAGWVHANPLIITLQKLVSVSGVEDYQRLDRELDHLRSLELIDYGFDANSTDPDISPTPLALHMYVRCQGSLLTPVEYFDLQVQEEP